MRNSISTDMQFLNFALNFPKQTVFNSNKIYAFLTDYRQVSNIRRSLVGN